MLCPPSLVWPDPSKWGLAKGETNAGDPHFSMIIVTLLLGKWSAIQRIPFITKEIGTLSPYCPGNMGDLGPQFSQE